MRVLWTHNFAPSMTNAGGFMHTLCAGVRASGVEVDLHYLGHLGSPATLLRARIEMTRIARGYDLVHAQFGSACAWVTAAAPGPKLVSLRGSDWHRYVGPHAGERRHALLARALSRMSLSRFDGVVTMSKRMTREVSVLHPKAQVVTIADPVDLTLFRAQDRAEARRRLFNESDGAPWVLFTTLSTTNPIKRADLAARSVELAARSVPGLQMRVASGLAHADMPGFISTCDVALCTSTHEGWPNAVKEALACGLPFVATDVSDLREIAARHPGCAVCEPDAAALAAALVRALRAPSDPGLRDEVNEMDVPLVARRLLSLYETLIGGRSNTGVAPRGAARALDSEQAL